MWPFDLPVPRDPLHEAAIRCAHAERAAAMRAVLGRLARAIAAPLRVAARIWEAWRRRAAHRRAREELMRWSDHQLADIGLRRGEIADAVEMGRLYRDREDGGASPATPHPTASAARPAARPASCCVAPRVVTPRTAACC